MDKQIEELSKLIVSINNNDYMYDNDGHKRLNFADADKIAEELLKYYQPKIPKNAVVVTREELFRDSTQLSKEKQIEIIHNIILENIDYGYEETATAIYGANYRKIPKLGVILPFDHYDNLLKTDKQVCKETAEKFAKRVKAHLKQSYHNLYHAEYHEGMVAINLGTFIENIDEICKELVDEKIKALENNIK